MFTIFTAFVQAGGIIMDKINLSRRRIAIHVYVPIMFLFFFLLTAILFPFLGRVSPEILQGKNLFLFGLMLVLAVIWNLFYYKGIESEKVHEFELIIMFQPLITIFLAAIFLKGENNLHILIAALIASIALIFSQIKKHHLAFSAGATTMIIAVLFMSLELIVIRLVLNFMSPVALYAIRTGIIFLFFFLFYKPRIFKVSGENMLFVLFGAVLNASQMLMKFYGFEMFGVVYTSLILILSPLLVFLASIFFFKEKLTTRTVASALVILACIVYATVLI